MLLIISINKGDGNMRTDIIERKEEMRVNHKCVESIHQLPKSK